MLNVSYRAQLIKNVLPSYPMRVLGIETSCDETAVAIVEDGREILVNLIDSQTDVHQLYGGVFPEVASRQHIHRLLPLVERALDSANGGGVEKIDRIAVTNGPGLVGALLMGVTAANTLGFGWNKPVVGVNHVEAHIYAAMMETKPLFPSLGVVISGGHTFLARMEAINSYQILATTVDDAAGEAFDKTAALLGYPYPGGPHIERLAQEGNSKIYSFLRGGQVKGRPYDFSFSGLKTHVLYLIKGKNRTKNAPTIIGEKEKRDLAASFQMAVFRDIIKKSLKVSATFPCKGIYVGGGVTKNKTLRQLFERYSPLPVFWPPSGLELDNAAMIAGLGYHQRPQDGIIETFPRIPTVHTTPLKIRR